MFVSMSSHTEQYMTEVLCIRLTFIQTVYATTCNVMLFCWSILMAVIGAFLLDSFTYWSISESMHSNFTRFCFASFTIQPNIKYVFQSYVSLQCRKHISIPPKWSSESFKGLPGILSVDTVLSGAELFVLQYYIICCMN